MDENGCFTWKKRPDHHFVNPAAARRWNAKWGGKEAGWSQLGYKHLSINQKKYLQHVLVWLLTYGEWPENSIDHIDGNRDNNCVTNLRCVEHKENLRNQSKKINNTSGVSGVYLDKRRNTWYVQIMKNYKKIHFGYYKDKEEAIEARHKAYKQLGFTERHGI